jgi:hypothetical protein
MKSLLLFLLLFSYTAQAQQAEEWITPFATVEFKQDKVHYYYVDAPAPFFLSPMFLPSGKLLPIQAYGRYFNHEDMSVWKPIIREDAEGSNFMGLSLDEKNHFLKAFTLQSIWGINQMDEVPTEDAWFLVVGLSNDDNPEIAGKAKLAAELYETILQGIEEMNKMRKQKF